MSGNPFWDYSLETYGKPGVAEACLALQDSYGLDVNCLLFCCWAAACGHQLTIGEALRLEEAVAEWRKEVVEPLRAVRRWMKLHAESQGVPALREAIKRDELGAEKLQQEMLNRRLPLSPPPEPPASQRDLAQRNLTCYLEALRRPRPDFTALLQAACA